MRRAARNVLARASAASKEHSRNTKRRWRSPERISISTQRRTAGSRNPQRARASPRGPGRDRSTRSRTAEPGRSRLAAPASLEIARDHVHVGQARLDVAEGNVDVAALAWDDGRITTRGTFAGVPVAALASSAGVKLPFVSTLTLARRLVARGGAAAQRLLTVRREKGDFFLRSETIGDSSESAFRVTTRRLSRRASSTMRSTRRRRSVPSED